MIPILIPIAAHRKPLQKQSSFLLLQSKSIWIIAETPVSGLAWGRMIDWRRYQMKGTQDISTMSGLIRGINSAAASTWKMQKAPFFLFMGTWDASGKRETIEKNLGSKFLLFSFQRKFLFHAFLPFQREKERRQQKQKKNRVSKVYKLLHREIKCCLIFLQFWPLENSDSTTFSALLSGTENFVRTAIVLTFCAASWLLASPKYRMAKRQNRVNGKVEAKPDWGN